MGGDLGATDVTPRDERPHAPGPELRWAESWTFDFVAADGSLAGWARIATLPNLGTGWYHAFLVGDGRPLVAVADTEVPVADASLEIRTAGLWATHICETALDHWTIGLEAFALGVDDPAELYGRQLGEQVPLGFDLEWEAEGPATPAGPGVGYEQVCRVSGEILVGREAIDFDGHGRRDHRWGAWEGWERRWFAWHGRLDDGTTLGATVIEADVHGAVATVDGTPVGVVESSRTMAGPGLPAGARTRLDDLDVVLEPVAVTPLEVRDPEGRRTRAPRALCRLTVSDGRAGWGWAEWNEPQLG